MSPICHETGAPKHVPTRIDMQIMTDVRRGSCTTMSLARPLGWIPLPPSPPRMAHASNQRAYIRDADGLTGAMALG